MVLLAVGSASYLHAQEAATAPGSPKLRLNMVQVCTPSDVEKSELSAAMARVPEKPLLAPDFEVARGRTTERGEASDWVRMRRDFASDSPFTSVQFLLSVSATGMDETLVFHFKANKAGEPLQLSFSNQISAGTPAAVLNSDTPPDHIRLERFGKSSLILARCPNVDQGAYAPLFQMAEDRFARFRTVLQIRTTVPAELAQLKASRTAPSRHAGTGRAGDPQENKRTK